jgi:hypothetical protein
MSFFYASPRSIKENHQYRHPQQTRKKQTNPGGKTAAAAITAHRRHAAAIVATGSFAKASSRKSSEKGATEALRAEEEATIFDVVAGELRQAPGSNLLHHTSAAPRRRWRGHAASTEELEDGISEKHGRHRRPDDRTGELPQVRRRREERRREGTQTGETKRP